MKTNSAINHIQRKEEVYGESLAFQIYETIHNDSVIKLLYNQRTTILENHTTPQLIYDNGTWTANLFSKEETTQLEKINKELQERYESLIKDIRHKFYS